MSFTLCMYHLLILIVILPRLGCSKILHDSCWVLKAILIVAIFIVAHTIPIGFYYLGWIHLVRFGSVIFLLIQTYFLLDLGYKWSELLNSGTAAAATAIDQQWAHYVMLAYTVVLFLCNVAVLVLCFLKFGQCTFGFTVLIIVSVMVAFFYVTSFFRLCDV